MSKRQKQTWGGILATAAVTLIFALAMPLLAEGPGEGGLYGLIETGGGSNFEASGTLDSNINLTVQGTGDIILPSGTRVNDDVGDGTISFEDSGGDGYGFFHTAGSNTVTLQDEAGVNNPNMTVPGNLSSNAFIYSKTGIRTGATDHIGWTDNDHGSAGTFDTSLVRVSAGVARFADGSTGQGGLIMRPPNDTTEPCGSLEDGTLVWDDTSNHLCVCIASVAEDVRDFTTNCF